MCLYPKLIKNPKYKPNKKNGGQVPAINDKRVIAVPIGCGQCYECLKKKANEWKVRLYEETKYQNKNKKLIGHYITLTFSNEEYTKLYKEINKEGYEADNAIAKKAVRRFLERWRKEHKKSVKHWLVTELGHNGTENIHLHGIIWTEKNKSEIRKHWKYGIVWMGYEDKQTYITERTINYITKYITKTDKEHKYYKSVILTSAGIGQSYTKRIDAKNNKYKEKKTKDYYTTKTGHKLSLPIYYRNKIYTEEEREKLWIEKLDKEIRFVDGIKIDISKSEKEYINIRNATRAKYKSLGYNEEINWKEKTYEEQRRKLLQKQRLKD